MRRNTISYITFISNGKIFAVFSDGYFSNSDFFIMDYGDIGKCLII